MTGLPTLTVELEDGSGNFTNDITAYVRQRSFTLSRGWSDENEEDNVQPAELKLELDNKVGEFTLGAANFNGITKDKRIRLSETVGGTTYRRVVGYVPDWPTKWESALANMAIAGITAMDRFARLNRRKLRSMLENELFRNSPAAYYALGEPAGSTSAGDTSGNGGATLTLTGDAALPVVFGNATGPGTDGLTAAEFAGGQYLTRQLAVTSSAVTFESFFRVEASAGASVLFAMLYELGGSLVVSLNASGFLVAEIAPSHVNIVGATSLFGGTHHAAVTINGATWTLYVDGVPVASSALGFLLTGNYTLQLGHSIDAAISGATGLTGVLSHWTAYNSALTTEIAGHANAGLTGFATDRADQRIARLASYANIAVADQNLEIGLQPSIAAQTTSGQSVLEAMRDVAASEGGGLFIAGDGKLTMHNKSHRVLKACGTPAITVTADLIDPDMTWAADNYLFNTATGSRTGGAQQRSVNDVSVGKYEEWPISRDNALLPTDELVLDELNWYTTMYGEPLPRLSEVTFDLLTLPQATVQALLALELGDLMRITGWPAQSPASSIDLIVEGFKEAQTETSWKLTFNTAPAQLFYAWILGDATRSVLGSTTRLYQ